MESPREIKKVNTRVSRSQTKFSDLIEVSNIEEPDDEFSQTIQFGEPQPEKKKDKKLVFLSRSVLQSVREYPQTTGTEIAY
jgi:hypothetical protein